MLDRRQMIIVACAIIAGIALFGVLKYLDGKDVRSDNVVVQSRSGRSGGGQQPQPQLSCPPGQVPAPVAGGQTGCVVKGSNA